MAYFAYGSNLSIARLRTRLPNSIAIGSFVLRGYLICFNKIGQDTTAKANIRRTGDPADTVLGVGYRLESGDVVILDRIEGLGTGYAKEIVEVEDIDGNKSSMFSYVALLTDESIRPYSWYLNHILVGARQASFPQEYISMLESVKCVDDPDPERKHRELAIYER